MKFGNDKKKHNKTHFCRMLVLTCLELSLTKPLTSSAKPRFVMELQDQHLDVGTMQLTWRCEARAIPFPTYVWYKNGERLGNSTTGDIIVLYNTLYLRNLVATRDNGVYQCIAENSHGYASSSAQLRILCKKVLLKKWCLS